MDDVKFRNHVAALVLSGMMSNKGTSLYESLDPEYRKRLCQCAVDYTDELMLCLGEKNT